MDQKKFDAAFEYAREQFAEQGVDVDAAMQKADACPLSMQCWQVDDVIGLDGGSCDGGISTTGSYPGRARNFEEMCKDIRYVFGLIPGQKRLNLHASYPSNMDSPVDRDAYTAENFRSWMDFAREENFKLDFNPTYFGHPMMDGNFTLSSNDEKKRRFWIEHGKACMRIAEAFGREQNDPSVINFWMPDGYKDHCVDSRYRRELMIASLDEILAEYNREYVKPAVESKLFGIGIESYTVASHEFSYGYAMSRKLLYCLDAGHFHPTETIAAKISPVLLYLDEILLHVSRCVRWDSDHVVLLNDELQHIMDEIVFQNYEKRVHIGMDFFDASINRIAAWAIGMRNSRKALLKAYLAPIDALKKSEHEGNFTKRMAMLEARKMMPFGLVWDMYCRRNNMPTDDQLMSKIEEYSRTELSQRG